MADDAELVARPAGRPPSTRGAAIDWFETSRRTRPRSAPSGRCSTREFRRFTTTARKLEAAVERPMCVGVFGPSQAGKSYLVSVLAGAERPAADRACSRASARDFIREINPVGEKESTGLVTRFSIRAQRAPAGPPGLPAPALGRRHRQDHRQHLLPRWRPQGRDRCRRPSASMRCSRAPARPPGRRSPGLSDEDVWDIQEYFEQQFAGVPYLECAGELLGRGRDARAQARWRRPDRAVLPALGRPRALFLPVPDAARRARAAWPRRRGVLPDRGADPARPQHHRRRDARRPRPRGPGAARDPELHRARRCSCRGR